MSFFRFILKMRPYALRELGSPVFCLIPKHKEEATDDIREKGERG